MQGSLQRAGAGVTVLIVIVLVALTLVVAIWLGYNKSVRLEEAVEGQWAQVENQLVRRFDLIPNLVETVKGYAAHERAVLENVTKARAQLDQAGDVGQATDANNQLTQALTGAWAQVSTDRPSEPGRQGQEAAFQRSEDPHSSRSRAHPRAGQLERGLAGQGSYQEGIAR